MSVLLRDVFVVIGKARKAAGSVSAALWDAACWQASCLSMDVAFTLNLQQVLRE
jgi:hypothetical protein